MKPTLVVLTGPTASGKSRIALQLCERFPFEIVNADSLQVFRRLDIGTAKPTLQEREKAPHHLIDVLNPDAPGTAHWYATEARKTIDDIVERRRVPLLVGGSGFYLRALEHPPEGPATVSDFKGDLADAHARILREDPKAAAKIHPNDRYRIGRAITLLDKGRLPSASFSTTASKAASYNFIWIGLGPEREPLVEKIRMRVERMFKAGLMDETRSVLHEFPAARKRLERTIGYRACLQVLEGRMKIDAAIQKTEIDTRQYAKRQMTWFRKEARMTWFQDEDPVDELVQKLNKELPW